MSSGERQLVYCHECENEWYKEEHGLKCPDCQSEFVEELGGSEDPRTELRLPPDHYDEDPEISVPDEHPLHNHNPWAHLHDPLTGDDEHRTGDGGFRFTQMPAGFHVEMRRTFSPGATPDPQAARGRPPDPMFDLQNNFFNMINGIMGAAPGARAGAPQAGGARAFGNVRVTTASFGGPGGATFRTETIHPQNGDGAQPGQPPVDDLHRMLTDTLFGGGTAGPGGHGGPFAQPFGANPFTGLLGLLNPAAAQHGDAVFTQEALDRVISQLMEQNQMGNAPPPATQRDIDTLPKMKVTEEMADPKTGEADCSICMEAVPVGEEVTRLWCRHWFHGDCVGAWLREHDSCPQCRKTIAQARDEAMGRGTSVPAQQGSGHPADSPSAHGQSTGMGTQGFGPLIGTSRGSGGNDAQGSASEPSQAPQEGSDSQQSRSQPQSPAQQTGFADRVRGLFGRGAGS